MASRMAWTFSALVLLALVALCLLDVTSAAPRKVPSAAERRAKSTASGGGGGGGGGGIAASVNTNEELGRRVEAFLVERRQTVADLITKAAELMNSNKHAKAIGVYQKLVEKLPGDPNAVMDLMTCYERTEQFDAAIDIGRDAMAKSAAAAAAAQAAAPKGKKNQPVPISAIDILAIHVPFLNKLCRDMIYGAAEARSTRYASWTSDARLRFLHSDVVPLCKLAAKVGANDHSAQYHIGHLLSVLHLFDESLGYTRQAVALLENSPAQLTPEDAKQRDIVLHDYNFLLCQTLSSILTQLAEAGKCVRRLVRKFAPLGLATANDYYMLGAHISSVQRYSEEARTALLRSNQVWAANNAASGSGAGGGCTKREFIPFWWLPSKHHTVEKFEVNLSELSFTIPETERVMGVLGYNSGSVGSWVPAHDFYIAHYQKVSLSVPSDQNSTQSVFYNDCMMSVGSHVLFARLSAQNQLTAKAAMRFTVSVPCPVIVLVSPNLWNYYHWFAEGMSTLLLSREFVVPKLEKYIRDNDLRENGKNGDKSSPVCTVKYLIPRATTLKSFAFESLKLLGFTSAEWIHHEPEVGKDYDLRHAFFVGWNDKEYDYHVNEDPAAYFAAPAYRRSQVLPPSVDPSEVPRTKDDAHRKFGILQNPARDQIPHIAQEVDEDMNALSSVESDRNKKLIKFLDANMKPDGSLVYGEQHRMPVVTGSYENDLWSLYFPPKEAMWMTRRLLSEAAMESLDISADDPTSSGVDQLNAGGIIYCSRGDDTHVRQVRNEQLLIDALRREYGNQSLTIWTGRGMSLANQIMTFRRASIVISPHGAAQTNMLWMRPGTAVVEFHVRNHAGVFGHMALAMGLEFWDLSEISAAYFKNFQMTDARVKLVLNVVNHILKQHPKWKLPAGAGAAAAATDSERDEL